MVFVSVQEFNRRALAMPGARSAYKVRGTNSSVGQFGARDTCRARGCGRGETEGCSLFMGGEASEDERTDEAEDIFPPTTYLGFLFGKMPPIPVLSPTFSETDLCIAPFAALPAKLPTSGIKLGFDVVP